MGDETTYFNTTASFTVDAPETAFPSLTPTPEPQPEPFPTTLVVGVIVSVAIIGVGLLFFYKINKSEDKPL